MLPLLLIRQTVILKEFFLVWLLIINEANNMYVYQQEEGRKCFI